MIENDVCPKMYSFFPSDTNMIRANPGDAGVDIRAVTMTKVTIGPQSSELIGTGLYVAIPHGHVGLIWSRSGLAVKYNIEVGAGCIDSGYRGEIKVLLRNFGESSFEVRHGDRIAQMILLPVCLTSWVGVESIEELGDTERGGGGFGSSGK